MDDYKVKQLHKMLEYETSKAEEHYGAHLTHWSGEANPINIDAGAIRVLIDYYSANPDNNETY